MVLTSLRKPKIPLWADFVFLIVLGLVAAMTVSWQSTQAPKSTCIYLPGFEAEVHCDAAMGGSEQVYE